MIAGIMRGVLVLVVSPMFSIILGIAVGKEHGIWYGVLGGLGAFMVFAIIAAKLVNSGGKLTTADCLIPTILAIISGILFAPIQLFSGAVFSAATCIYAGVLMSTALFLYKNGRMSGWALILPALTFVYELLPIELPTDLDNFFALGGASLSFWGGYIKRTAIAYATGKEDGASGLLDNQKDS